MIKYISPGLDIYGIFLMKYISPVLDIYGIYLMKYISPGLDIPQQTQDVESMLDECCWSTVYDVVPALIHH